jgi:hypothetical protein
LGDPKSDIYNPAYEEYLKETPHKEAARAFTPGPAPVPPPQEAVYTPGMVQKIENCPHRSMFIVVVENNVQIRKHVYKDGTDAEGCGCGKMRCKLGKGVNGDVAIDDCTACIEEQEAVENPSLLQKAKSVTSAIVKHVAAGLPTIPDEVKENRLAICRGCIHYDNGTCKVCGCSLFAKCSLPKERCPLSPPKWDAIP